MTGPGSAFEAAVKQLVGVELDAQRLRRNQARDGVLRDGRVPPDWRA